MRKVKIFAGKRYHIESHGNGLAYEITRLDDGASVFIQNSDAYIFREVMNRTNDRYTCEDLCDEYFIV